MSAHSCVPMRCLSRTAVVVGLVCFGSVATSVACTTAVISGRATMDGRPILWKNRDTQQTLNEVILFNDEEGYETLAVVNAGNRSSIWMGVNEAGLCIENSVTRDLAHPKDVEGPGNGGFMLMALRRCATVEEVQRLLEETDKSGRSTCANFGVIDARGGAVLFETSRNAHVMFDANDPRTAPEGIVVRSNFSMSGQSFDVPPSPGQLADIYSGERYLRACHLISAVAGDELDLRYVLRSCARDMADGRCVPFPGTVNGPDGSLPEFIETSNTISRTTTVSFAVFHGVRSGEDPLLTTMWLGLGDPKFAVAIPCWVGAEVVAAELQGKKHGGPLGQAAIALRERYYSSEDDGIRTDGLQEIWSQLWSFEDRLIDRLEKQLARWRADGVNPRAMAAQHLSAAEQALTLLSEQVESVPLAPPASAAESVAESQ
jgi:hypothetical protein